MLWESGRGGALLIDWNIELVKGIAATAAEVLMGVAHDGENDGEEGEEGEEDESEREGELDWNEPDLVSLLSSSSIV